MGVSVSAASAIIFISVMLSISILWDAMGDRDEIVDEAREEQYKRYRETLDTHVYYINITYDSTTDEIWINSLNNGSTVVNLNYIDVYVDGNHSENISYAFPGHPGSVIHIWSPQETVNITVGDILYEPARVKLSCSNGISIYGSSITTR